MNITSYSSSEDHRLGKISTALSSVGGLEGYFVRSPLACRGTLRGLHNTKERW